MTENVLKKHFEETGGKNPSNDLQVYLQYLFEQVHNL